MADITLPYINSYYDSPWQIAARFSSQRSQACFAAGLAGFFRGYGRLQRVTRKNRGSPTTAEIGAGVALKLAVSMPQSLAIYKDDAVHKNARSGNGRTCAIQSLITFVSAARQMADDTARTLSRLCGGRDYGVAALKGDGALNAQKNWLKALRGWDECFVISQGKRSDDPSVGIKAWLEGPKSSGHKTWLEPQVARHREHHK